MYWWYYKEYLLSTGWTTGIIQDGSAMILSKWDCFHWTDYYWQRPIGNKWSINKINFKFEEDTHLHPVFLLSKYEYWCRFLHVPNKAMNGKTLKFSELSWRCYGKHHAVEKKITPLSLAVHTSYDRIQNWEGLVRRTTSPGRQVLGCSNPEVRIDAKFARAGRLIGFCNEPAT